MKLVKPCKGTSKALGYGCGDEVSVRLRKYGLCRECYKDWYFNAERSTITQKNSTKKCKECKDPFTPFSNNSLQKYCMVKDDCITASLKHLQEGLIKQAQRDKSKHKVDSMTMDKYRATYIQPLINLLARIIDKGQPCICTELFDGKMNGGHRHSTGSNRTLTYNLHNVHNQSFHSNHHQSGDHLKYRQGLKRVYSLEYADFIDDYLMQCPPLHITKDDLVELKPRLQKIVNHYKKLDKVYTATERIELRNELNLELELYPKEFAIFK